MGGRDFQSRETKKQKKDSKKPAVSGEFFQPNVEPEVVRKKKKGKDI
ncbi:MULTISPECIES: hypothetical protein [Dehalococcoides]|jgi:hypothetical protein|uniref:Uncharacterized protein n=1 Tax=Dehalococcoides mccartyi (strain VS) TaxID=311424 RepID=D2BI68_DEHMV|nr:MULTISPECIES: hypothetical protein [Dehalococcoides]ACZ62018.1 hypothetical protein DhcVS_898 [Dehalococcoides mccartyi VS]AHB13684.1 hypothetical protein GY50_0911 [Dehalococcoides mccartyi GY50]AII58060.1 hypothetical protein X792_04715 [Dehalococcoides mccartyi CG1]QYY57912.1 hypothetical protein CWV2_001198 [Dehalococcoides mccartyi]BAQ34820.1 hypothetical protein UCH007_08620 [Dehalococcoides sp. UCH007]